MPAGKNLEAHREDNSLKPPLSGDETASARISRRIAELGDWRGSMLEQIRALIQKADPKVEEEWKWRGVPVWSHGGIICTGESYREVVKLTFARGAALNDPKKLFNSSLEGNVRRAIDIREGDKINAAAFKALVRTAVAANMAALAERTARKKKLDLSAFTAGTVQPVVQQANPYRRCPP